MGYFDYLTGGLMRWFAILHTIIELSAGALILAFPAFLAKVTNASLTQNEGLQFARLFGVSLITVGVLTWKLRDLTESKSLVPAFTSLFVYHLLISITLVYGQVMGFRNAFGWLFPLGHGSFTVGFGLLLLKLKSR